MRFEIKHTFRHPPEAVAAAMFDPAAGALLSQRMSTIIEVEALSRSETGRVLEARTRYLPVPLIRKVGPKTVEPRWMEWVAELRFDHATLSGTFRNLPTTRKVAQLIENRGELTLRATPAGTERTLTGELRVKVPLLGRIAEKIIHKNAVEILDDEARVLEQLIGEGLVGDPRPEE